MKHLWLTHLRLCEFWSQKPSCTSDDFSGDNAVRDGKRDVFSLKMFVFICCSVSKTHFDSVLWDNEQKGCVTLHKQCTCHLFEHWVWNIMQFRRIFFFFISISMRNNAGNKKKPLLWKQCLWAMNLFQSVFVTLALWLLLTPVAMKRMRKMQPRMQPAQIIRK